MTEALKQTADGHSDAALIRAVRRGETSAYGVLYQRHLGAAKRAATYLATATAEREDLVAEAFTRVLRVLRSGRGPAEDFRPYLLVTMRNAAINATRRGVMLSLYADVPDAYLGSDGGDWFSSWPHDRLVASAFASLPERWRMVLWHTEIEGESPAAIAPLLGMTPNGVAALAYRAREGLRQAYLQRHLPTVARRDCRAATGELAGWVRRGISAQKMRRITAHLDRCENCRELAAGLVKINSELRGVLAPIVLGAPFAVAYLQASALSAVTPAGALAAAPHVGAATVTCMSAVKATFTATACKIGAAAAIATATAFTSVASDPVPITGESGTAVSAPSDHQRTVPAERAPLRTPDADPATQVPDPADKPPTDKPDKSGKTDTATDIAKVPAAPNLPPRAGGNAAGVTPPAGPRGTPPAGVPANGAAKQPPNAEQGETARKRGGG